MRIERPSIETRLATVAREHRDLNRLTGAPIYFGTYGVDPNTTYESPPFENGWHWDQSDPSFPQPSLWRDKFRHVHYDGAIAGGAPMTVVTTIPYDYRPAATERFVVPGPVGPAVIQIDPTGKLWYLG